MSLRKHLLGRVQGQEGRWLNRCSQAENMGWRTVAQDERWLEDSAHP